MPSQTLQQTTTAHHIIDGYRGDTLLLHNPNTVKTYIHAIHGRQEKEESHLLVYETGPQSMHGVTAMVLSPGKHSTIHTYSHPQKSMAFIDSFNTTWSLDQLSSATAHSFSFETNTTFTESRGADIHSIAHDFLYQDKETYGPHLLVEGYVQDNRLIDTVVLEHLLSTLASQIGMTPIYGPVSVEDNRYTSALIVIAESHLALHYHQETKRMFLDIFSCKAFPVPFTITLLQRVLYETITHISLFKRGKGFYASL